MTTTTKSNLYCFLFLSSPPPKHIEIHFDKRKGRIIHRMYYTIHTRGGTLICRKIYSYHALFFLLFHYFKIIRRQPTSDCFICVLFHYASYSTTQRHEIHQQVKKRRGGRRGVDCKYYITYEQY